MSDGPPQTLTVERLAALLRELHTLDWYQAGDSDHQRWLNRCATWLLPRLGDVPREPSPAAIEAALEACPLLWDVQQVNPREVNLVLPRPDQARVAVRRILRAAYQVDGLLAPSKGAHISGCATEINQPCNCASKEVT